MVFILDFDYGSDYMILEAYTMGFLLLWYTLAIQKFAIVVDWCLLPR